MKITYFGTTTLLFDDGRDQILFDAHVTRPSLLQYIGNARVGTDRALCGRLIELHHIDRLRAVFISHTHHDHVMDAPYIADRCGAALYGSESARNVALGGGVPAENIVVFRHGGRWYMIFIAISKDTKILSLLPTITMGIRSGVTVPTPTV